LLPHLEASARAEKTRASESSAEFERFDLGLGAAYELDLWGRIRSGVDAEQYRAEAVLADYRAAAVSLSAEIAVAWYRLAEAERGLALADEQIETNETVETLLTNRFGTGQVRAVDILRQRQLVEAARQRRALLVSQARVWRHQLAVLTGKPPRGAALPAPAVLPELPPLPLSRRSRFRWTTGAGRRPGCARLCPA
jgi:outer membrane protein TolC